MALHIARKLLRLIPVLLLVITGTTFLVDLIPGDPAVNLLGDSATPQQIARVHQELGLNHSFTYRVASYVGNALQGNLGRSLITQRTVSDTIGQAIPVTIEVALLGLLLAAVLAVPTALLAARRPGRFFDRLANGIASLFVSSPSFLTALLLVYFLAVKIEIFPVSGWVALTTSPVANVEHCFLPALTLAVVEAPVWMRVLRADLISTLNENYILTAVARGTSEPRVLLGQALKPSLFSLLTMIGISLGRMIGGAVIVEVIFSLPGFGNALYNAILNRDLVTIQGMAVFVAALYVVVNVLLDVAYTAIDPRVRASH